MERASTLSYEEYEIPKNIPDDRCGLTTTYIGQQPIGNITCWRESWADHERCIWHADETSKPTDELVAARSDNPERLDFAILNELDLKRPISFEDCTLRGAECEKTFLAGIDFTDAHMAFVYLSEAHLEHADFTDAFCNLADFTKADLRHATLSGTNMGGAILTGAAMSYSELGDAKYDERTKFGGRSRWEASADEGSLNETPELLQIPLLRFLGRRHALSYELEQAELQYRATQRVLRLNDLRELPELAVREKDARRKRAFAERQYQRWFKLAFYRRVLGYGERISTVLRTTGLVILGFGLIYPFVGGMRTLSQGRTLAFDRIIPSSIVLPEWIDIFAANLYFSAVTFTTLGYGDIQPGSTMVQVLASLESLLGAALIALLVFVLGRRATW